MVRNEFCWAAAVLLAVPAAAAEPAAGERRLSPGEVEKILEAAAVKNAAAAKPAEALSQSPRPIEGEVGVSIGSGGYRDVFGTAIVPVGAEGMAIISIDGAELRRDTRRRP